MLITKKAIPRRAVLRGLGATMALPLLDAMVPSLTALQNTAAKPVTRFGVMYVPNGMVMDQWTPVAEGASFELTSTLAPLVTRMLTASIEAAEAASWSAVRWRPPALRSIQPRSAELAATSRATIGAWPRRAARWSGVAPSGACTSSRA